MKFLDAKKENGENPTPGLPVNENKMQEGTRTDQQSRVKLATPDLAKLADDSNVDLNTVTPTGKNGTITRQDIQKAASTARNTSTSTPSTEQ